MKHWDKSIDYLYSLIVVFWFDAKSPLVQMKTHNKWSSTQQLPKNQHNRYQSTKIIKFKYVLNQDRNGWDWSQWNDMLWDVTEENE